MYVTDESCLFYVYSPRKKSSVPYLGKEANVLIDKNVDVLLGHHVIYKGGTAPLILFCVSLMCGEISSTSHPRFSKILALNFS